MVRTKVFVGNLSFKTKEPELKAHFSTAGNVIDVNIITRGPRSLGYGFVEMESEEAANAAIQSLHHKDVDGRQINVELVKEPKEGEEAVPRERKPRPPRQPREGGENDEADATKRPPREPREPRERKPQGERREGGNATGNAQGGNRAPRENKPRAERADNKGPRTEKPKTEGGDKKPREAREPREPREREPREPREPRAERPKKNNAERSESDTLLFVANLPFSLDNETFLKFVTDLNLSVKQAYVVKKHNNRSKGYGFIEFNNQAEQKAGLEKLNGLNIQDRPISVKIALTQAVEPETEGKQEAKPASTPATPAAQSPKPAADPKSPKTAAAAAASPKKTQEKQ